MLRLRFPLFTSQTKKLSLCALALAAFVLTPSMSQAQRRVALRRGNAIEVVPGQIIVYAQPGTGAAAVRAAADAAGCDIKRVMLAKDGYLLSVRPVNGVAATKETTVATANTLKQSKVLRWAGPDRTRPLHDVPNDPMYAQQWHHNVMNMPNAWGLQKGTNDVTVVVLDSGIDVNHPDLKDRLIGYKNYVDGSSDVTDNIPHGTHTSGIAAASTDNAIGVAGVAWANCGLYMGKVGEFGILDSAVEDALTYIRTTLHQGGKKVVVNMSFGGADSSDDPDPNDPYNKAILDAANDGIVICISAGNDFDQGNPPTNPANLAQLSPNILCVGACGKNKEHSFYSTSRRYTTISAPGGDDPTFSVPADQILSTFPVSMNSYGSEQGTSMAAPACTGVVALLLSAGADPFQVKSILTTTADAGGRAVPNNDFGYGVVDAYAALSQVISGVNITSPSSGAYVYSNSTAVQLTVGDPSKFLGAELRIGNDTTAVATIGSSGRSLTWDTLATDTSGGRKYPNGNYTLKIKINTPSGPLNFTRQVKVDNPIALITGPASNGFITKTATVTGTADGLRVPTYSLEYSTTQAPSTWIPILTDQQGRVQSGTLTTWNLSGVPDGTVNLRLRVKNPDNFEVNDTKTVTVDQTPPSAPGNIAGVSSHRQAALSWTASTDNNAVAGYIIYRSTQSLTGFTKLTQLTNIAYTDMNLANGTTYYYKVTAIDTAGNESVLGPAINVTPNRNGIPTGQVISTGGASISGVAMSVLQNGTVVSNGTATTDTSGQYTFPAPPGFPTGTYDLTAAKSGYVPQIIRGISLDIGKDANNQNFALQPQPAVPGGWSMFTLPYDFAGADLTAVFGASSGSLRYYNPATGTYVLPGDAAFPKPAAGIAYWINVTGGSAPQVTGPGVPNSAKVGVKVPIHPGWNLIGNPFQDPIRWKLNDLVITRSDNGQVASLSAAVGLGWGLDFAWGGVDGKTLIYDTSVIPGIADTIPAYGGFWYRSEVEGFLNIAPPAVLSRAASAGSGMNSWTTQLVATSSGKSSAVYVGLGSSNRTFPAPPQIVDTVKLALTGSNRSANAVDLRTAATTQTWDVNVTGVDDKPITLSWPSASLIPRGWKLFLVDQANGQRINLQNSSGYTINSGRAVHSLQLELTRTLANGIVLVSNLTVNSTRSNSPVINFNVNGTGQATVSILKANGETVRTLTSRAAKAGDNSVVWDARDSSGKSVAAGVYLVQVRLVGEKGDQARAILPFVVTR